MQANLWHHKLFHFHLQFESRKCGKEGKKLQKFEHLENKKSFLDKINLSFDEKIKIWWKIADISFKETKWVVKLLHNWSTCECNEMQA